ncbi:hypothetical protein Mapa_017455 [Marchantia paleacea]|nr:hypothetical protein Mapa_017455 [Marchantia paleacea]
MIKTDRSSPHMHDRGLLSILDSTKMISTLRSFRLTVFYLHHQFARCLVDVAIVVASSSKFTGLPTGEAKDGRTLKTDVESFKVMASKFIELMFVDK